MLSEILPPRILRFDQRDFLDPQPAFQLFLSSDGSVHVVEAFVVDQAVAMILAGESLDFAGLVLQARR
jgi:hypothetical protein